jgi:acyl carrier protein
MENTLKIIKQHIHEKLGIDEFRIEEKSSFINDLGADSLDMYELIVELEKEFDLSIPDEDAERIRTVGDLNRYIITHALQNS